VEGSTFAACLSLPNRFATAAARSASSIMVGNHHNHNAILSAEGFVNHKIRMPLRAEG